MEYLILSCAGWFIDLAYILICNLQWAVLLELSSHLCESRFFLLPPQHIAKMSINRVPFSWFVLCIPLKENTCVIDILSVILDNIFLALQCLSKYPPLQLMCWNGFKCVKVSNRKCKMCKRQLCKIILLMYLIQNDMFLSILKFTGTVLLTPIITHGRHGVSNHWQLDSWINSLSGITNCQANCLSSTLSRLAIKEKSSLSLALCERNPPVTRGFPSQRVSDAESVSMSWRHNTPLQLPNTSIVHFEFLHRTAQTPSTHIPTPNPNRQTPLHPNVSYVCKSPLTTQSLIWKSLVAARKKRCCTCDC